MGKHTIRGDRFTPAPVAAPVASSAASPGGKGVSAPTRPKVGWKILLAALGLGLLALLAYWNSFTGGWVLDNASIIGEDPRIRDARIFDKDPLIRGGARDNMHAIFIHNYWWPTFESNLYRPLTTLSYMLNYSVLDDGARVEKVRQEFAAQNKPFDYSKLDNGKHLVGYHRVNFLLHWANIVLVLVIVRRLAGRLDLAIIAAGIFAVHPINVEVVSNIVGRADLLATLSILLSGWCYIRATKTSGGRRAAWLVGAGLNTLWGVFAKESAILVCLLVFMYDMIWRWPGLPGPTLWRRTQQAFRQFFLKGWMAVLLPTLICIGVYIYWKFQSPVFGEIFCDNPIAGADTWFQGRMTALKVLGRYLSLLVYPSTFSADYSYNQVPLYGLGGNWEDAQCWLALGAIAGLLGLAFWLRRTQPLLSFGILMIFLTQILTSNVFVAIGTIMADRFEYLPSVGYAILAAQVLCWAGAALARLKIGGRVMQFALIWTLAGLLAFALSARTFIRNKDWQEPDSLWKSMVDASPNSFKAYKGYASVLWQEARDQHPGDTALKEEALDQAIQLGERGLSILDNPPLPISKQDNTLYQQLGDQYRLKGEFLTQRQKPEEAREYYNKSLAVLLRARDVDHWVNQTSHETRKRHGQPDNKISDVGNYLIYVLLSLTYGKLDDWPNAAAAGSYAVRLKPTDAVGYRLTALAYYQNNRPADAIVEALQGLLLDSNNGAFWNELANYYQKLGTQPIPILFSPKDNTYHLNINSPLVHEEVNQASVQLIHHLEEGMLLDDASRLKANLIKTGVPAEMFDQK